MEPDFGGYATKANLVCSDGLTITPNAFRHMDGVTVPLVWQHMAGDPENVLGHALLEARDDGVYAKGFFNSTPAGQKALELVKHKDITSLSIYANNLIKNGQNVMHGIIREVSLVLAGANPGALIDPVTIAHSDGEIESLDSEAVITTGLAFDGEIEHEDKTPQEEHGKTVADVYGSMNEEQRSVLHFMIGEALKSSVNHSATQTDPKGKEEMGRNVFDASGGKGSPEENHSLSHDAVKGIMTAAVKCGSLQQAVSDYALAHNITNIDVLFPDAKNINNTPEFDKRRTEWVAGVLNATRHSPFSRIKSIVADITHDDARAKGYIKGNLKKEEFFSLTSRSTAPTTVYKKQKLDRDDVIDITDFDVVAWIKAEMRLMLEEEIARAILIGDGRLVTDEDKIKDPAGSTEGSGIRSIYNDHELYAARVAINDGKPGFTPQQAVDTILTHRALFRGTGIPTFYTTETFLTYLLLARAADGRRLWKTVDELASELRVSSIVTVEAMESVNNLIGIMVNLTDYTIGADRGGETSMFEDFDLDYNAQKYLLETRISGALTKIRSAVVIERVAANLTLATPVAPTFNGTSVSIPTVTGVVYRNADTNAVLTNGSSVTVADGATLNVTVTPAAGYYIETSDNDWSFTNPA